MNKNTCIIVPVYNESAVIKKVIEKLTKTYAWVVCVNDGSIDSSSSEIMKTGAILVEHSINLGQGAALQTGISYGLKLEGVKYFVTFDADGQHNMADVKKMVAELDNNKADIVLGSRFLNIRSKASLSRWVVLKLAIRFTNLISGVKLTDTHNGLRAFNREFAEKLQIKVSGMGHASEIIDIIGRGNWRYKEVPVSIKYTDYSRSKGQSSMNLFNIIVDFVLQRASK